jgi:hypothetical protein
MTTEASNWRTVREGRWEESWATCLLHLQNGPDHVWLEDAGNRTYRVTFGGEGSTGILAVSRNAAALRELLASDEAIELLFASAAPEGPVFV